LQNVGLPGFTIVGLTDRAIQEARERVKPAIRNAGFKFPQRRVTVNLAPAELPKEGTGFDLAIAIAILRAEDQSIRLDGLAFLGELALDGSLRPVTGVLPMARCLAAVGIRRLIVPAENAPEAALAEGLEVLGAPSLQACVEYLRGEGTLVPGVREASSPGSAPEPDLAAVRGQGQAKRALEIAAAGGHNVLMTGPPGAGKTMLARTFPSLLPDLPYDAALEVAAIYSLRGTLRERPPTTVRPPFRSPHHSISRAGLVGGGTGLAQPGEISLAHPGVTLSHQSQSHEAGLPVDRQPPERLARWPYDGVRAARGCSAGLRRCHQPRLRDAGLVEVYQRAQFRIHLHPIRLRSSTRGLSLPILWAPQQQISRRFGGRRPPCAATWVRCRKGSCGTSSRLLLFACDGD